MNVAPHLKRTVSMQAVSEVRLPAEEHVKRLELLLHENKVLTTQNAELDKEVERLHTDNEGLPSSCWMRHSSMAMHASRSSTKMQRL